MKNHRFSLLGWAAATVLAVVGATAGFQPAQAKFGVVDLSKVIDKSKMQQTNQTKFQNAVELRRGLVTFVDAHPVISQSQADRIKTLTLQPTLTEAEKTELETVKKAVVDANANFDALNKKTSPTDADRALMADYGELARNSKSLLTRWDTEFTRDVEKARNDLTNETIDAARAAAVTVAKREGFTVVFEAGTAVYAANDITDATLTAMNGG